MKVLAIGDIHTKLWVIDAVKNRVDDYDAVVFVGDYADDWNSMPQQTIDTWRALKDFQEEYINKVDVLIGNHDYIYVNQTSTISSGYNTTTQMLLASVDNKDLKDWLSSLPVTIMIDGVVYSHAGLSEEWMKSFIPDNRDHYTSKNLWRDDSPIWSRPGSVDYRSDFHQVFGHTPSETCWQVEPNVWCIDTFSTYQDGTPVGDGTVLEVFDGTVFNKIKLQKETKNGNDSSTGIET